MGTDCWIISTPVESVNRIPDKLVFPINTAFFFSNRYCALRFSFRRVVYQTTRLFANATPLFIFLVFLYSNRARSMPL